VGAIASCNENTTTLSTEALSYIESTEQDRIPQNLDLTLRFLACLRHSVEKDKDPFEKFKHTTKSKVSVIVISSEKINDSAMHSFTNQVKLEIKSGFLVLLHSFFFFSFIGIVLLIVFVIDRFDTGTGDNCSTAAAPAAASVLTFFCTVHTGISIDKCLFLPDIFSFRRAYPQL
jgi:hypothetical protein